MRPASDRDRLIRAVEAVGSILNQGLAERVAEPDFPPMEFARIWLAFAETKLVVPVGVWTRCTFGPWAGPQMPVCDIAVHGYFMKDNAPVRGFLGRPQGSPPSAWDRQLICSGCTFETSIQIHRE